MWFDNLGSLWGLGKSQDNFKNRIYMNEYCYQDEITSLLRNVQSIKKDDIYDYFDTELEYAFDSFFNFCLENLRENCAPFDINPSYFYFQNSNYVNASACKYHNNYIIRVNKGVLEQLHRLFIGSTFFTEQNRNDKFTDLQEVCDTPIAGLMFQYATLFTYYHELAHLIQKSDLLELSLNEDVTKIDDDQVMKKHILEIDADWFAAHKIAEHICKYWQSIVENNPGVSKDLLNKLVIISATSIHCYLAYSFENFQPDLYFNEHSHPHTAIRLTLVLGIINDYLHKHLGVPKLLITQSTIDLSNQLFKHIGHDEFSESYRNKVLPHHDKIIEYAVSITNELGKYPELASNRLLNIHTKLS